jgi:hypothetical protein
MRILLIGNFSPPYEEENLHNLTLLNQLIQEGHVCCALNIGEFSKSNTSSISENIKIIAIKNYIDFIMKLLRFSYSYNVIHFLTKGYVRPGLMKLMTAVILGKFMLKRVVITLHPELFSIFGQLRSKMGGQQLLHLSFNLADKVICGDQHTYEVASLYYSAKDKFTVIPPFFYIPKDHEEALSVFRKLENKKRIIVFSGVTYPSFIFDVINELLMKYLSPDIGIIVSIHEKKSQQLLHVLEDADQKFQKSIVFIWPSDNHQLSMGYARADLVVRTLSCEGKALFNKIAIAIKKPARTEKYLYFPRSLLVIKEGNTAGLCAYTIHNLLREKTEKPPLVKEDFYQKIREIYSQGF